ncbi:MAG: hypothetical protein WCJ58_01485 [bacterium]
MFKVSVKNFKAFSLIEVLLNLGIVALFMVAITLYFNLLLNANMKNKAISEVNQEGMQIILILNQAMRDANAVSIPGAALTLPNAQLASTVVGLNPTIINLSGTNLQIKEGPSAYVILNSNRVQVSALSFTNVGITNSKGSIKYQFTLTYVNPDNKSQLRYQKTFYDSATLR